MYIPKGIRESIPPHLHRKDHVRSQVWCDLHAPQHDAAAIELALERARQTDTKRLIIAGDALNLGWASSFLGRTGYSPEDTEEEFQVCEQLFKQILTVFDQIIIVGGNHCEGRWSKVIGGQVEFARLLRMILGDEVVNKMVITERRYCTIDTPNGVWRFTHQAGKGRKRQLSMAEELASVTGQHIVMGHQHYLGAVVDRTGKYWCIDGGHMCDPSLMEYKNHMDSLHTSWASGFVELDELGIPRVWRSQDLRFRNYHDQCGYGTLQIGMGNVSVQHIQEGARVSLRSDE
jgi:hypothetical protein